MENNMYDFNKEYKCGEIFLSESSIYFFICLHCKEKFENFTSFRIHREYIHQQIDSKTNFSLIAKQEPDEETYVHKIYEHILIEKYENNQIKELDSSSQNSYPSNRDYFDETQYAVCEERVNNKQENFISPESSNYISLNNKGRNKRDELLIRNFKYNERCNDKIETRDLNFKGNENLNEYTIENYDSDEFDSGFAKQNFEYEENNDFVISSNEIDYHENKNLPKFFNCTFCKKDLEFNINHDQKKCATLHNTIKEHDYDSKNLQDEGNILCSDCPSYFESQEKLSFHKTSHCNDGMCPICDKHFIRLNRHMKSKHSEVYGQNKNVKSSRNGILQCSYCEKKFKLQIHLQRHELNHQNEALKCQFCGKFFKALNLLKNHIRTHTGEKPFKCSHCPASFALKRNLRTHFIYKHTDSKPFECRFESGCGKYFKTEQLRNNHEKRHNENAEFQCEICGIHFNVKAKLRMHHKKKHMDYSERPHHCQFCEKKFVEKDHLREHERTHTGEKPLKCNQCSSSFAKKSSLREHKKLHSGEKRHVCKICGKAFAQLAGYSNHMKNHP